MIPTPKDDGFLHYFYRIFVYVGLGVVALGLIAGGIKGAKGTALGFASMGFVLWLWHRMTALIIRPRKARVSLEATLFLFRYALLAGLFYAMIRLFAVSPAWFALGMTTLVFAVSTAAALYKDPVSDDDETPGES